VLYCNVLSRVPTDKDQDLLRTKGGDGFPTLIFMDSEGNVLARHEDERDAGGFARTGKKAGGFLELKAKAAKGDKPAQIELAIAQLELWQVTAEEARKRIAALGKLPQAQQEKVDGLLVTAEVREVLQRVTDAKETQVAAGRKFLEMKKAGRAAPKGDEVEPYWILMMTYAEDQKDAGTFADALKALKEQFGANPQAAGFFKEKEAALKTLQDAKK